MFIFSRQYHLDSMKKAAIEYSLLTISDFAVIHSIAESSSSQSKDFKNI